MLVYVEVTMSQYHSRPAVCLYTSVNDQQEALVLKQNLSKFVRSEEGQATDYFRLGKLGMDVFPKYGKTSIDKLLSELRKATGHEFTIKDCERQEDTITMYFHLNNSLRVKLTAQPELTTL